MKVWTNVCRKPNWQFPTGKGANFFLLWPFEYFLLIWGIEKIMDNLEDKIPAGLFRFVKAKEAEIRLLEESGDLLSDNDKKLLVADRSDFLEALKNGREKRGIAVIAEYKRASPSMGDIFLELLPAQAAEAYGEADCISVLTEETYFKGSLDFLTQMDGTSKPLLRKDFIFNPLQVLATAKTPASAILLIVRLVPEISDLGLLYLEAEKYGLRPVVEIFDKKDLEVARKIGAKIIQVNARNLDNLKVDTESIFDFARDNHISSDEFWIAASGMTSGGDLVKARKAGYGAVLMGTTLMRLGQPQKALADILSQYGAL
jgi:indole-3-glycerol phosphate synthase